MEGGGLHVQDAEGCRTPCIHVHVHHHTAVYPSTQPSSSVRVQSPGNASSGSTQFHIADRMIKAN